MKNKDDSKKELKSYMKEETEVKPGELANGEKKDAYNEDKKVEVDEDNEFKVTDEKSDELTAEEKKKLLAQVIAERKYCYDYQKPKIEEWLIRLKLFNNQRREKDKVGDPLLFTVFQTVFAALYSDTLQVKFQGRETGDYTDASILNSAAEYDYEVMEKDVFDYDYTWDALFFGRAIAEMTHFDRETMTPIPRVIDPTVFLRDPHAKSVRGDAMGNGAARFMGEEMSFTLWRLKENTAFFDVDKIAKGTADTRTGGNADGEELMDRAREERAAAQNLQDSGESREHEIGDNAEYPILKWYTHFNGEKCVVYLAPGYSHIIRYHKIKSKYFPVFDRPMYPTSHDWDGTSIPDVLEDKQRLKAIILNAMADSAKADVYPEYLYDTNKIKNRADLDFGFNKHTGIDGDPTNAIIPKNKAQINSVLADYILQTLDASAQKATATPEIQQGAMSDQDRTATELNLISSKSSTRYGLTAKVFGWSEKRLWRHWYWMLKEYMENEIDKKLVRISGAYGVQYREFTKDQIIREIDPDIQVVSKQVSEAETIRKRIGFNEFMKTAIQEKSANIRYLHKVNAKLYLLTPAEIDRIFSPTAAELVAMKENESLNKNMLVDVQPNDNHIEHLESHMMASETPAKEAHMFAHKEALRLMQEDPSLFPDMDPMTFQRAGITPPGTDPNAVAAPGGGAPVQAEAMTMPRTGLS